MGIEWDPPAGAAWQSSLDGPTKARPFGSIRPNEGDFSDPGRSRIEDGNASEHDGSEVIRFSRCAVTDAKDGFDGTAVPPGVD